MIKLINVNKKYDKKTIFKNINYTFPDTGLYVINGESGVGKTTLLKIIANRIDYKGEVYKNEEIFSYEAMSGCYLRGSYVFVSLCIKNMNKKARHQI